MFRPAIVLFAAVTSAGFAPTVVDRSAPSPVQTISRENIARLPTGRSVEDLLRVCPARTIPTVGSPAQGAPAAGPTLGPSCVQPDDLRMVDIYRAHNLARAQVGSPPLVWDWRLALQANEYAREMARTGQLTHSSRDNRKLVRENLLRAPRGWSPKQMIGLWAGERQNLIPGIFPNVSRTGSWMDIAHYTQMVWPTTTSIGCAMQPGGEFNWLICRYSPPGNRDGVAIAPGGVILAPKRPDVMCIDRGGGVMMCPGPGDGAKQGGGKPRAKQDEGGNAQGGNAQGGDESGQSDHPTTTERPTEPTPSNDDGIGTITGDCGVGVIAKVHIKEPVDPQEPNKTRREKESHNLAHGFSEIVIPDGWDATVDFRPDPNPRKTFPVPGTMVGTWTIQGMPAPFEGRVTGGYPALQKGWTTVTGPTEVNPPARPTVQQHSIHAEWDPTPPTRPDKCTTDYAFTVTFAAEIPEPAGLNLRTFVDENGRRPGTRGREHPTTGTRAFHEEHPHSYSRNNNVVVPIGIYWSLDHNCCGIKPASRKVIQFARAAIHGPNGREGKGWGLDILPSEMTRANPNPTYTGDPRNDGNEMPTAGGAGGTRTVGDDVVQWDAPGMPKDLYDRLFAAQGASVYRQQFLSLLVCRPPGTVSIRANLASALICRVGITTIRWDFPGQAGIVPRPPRRGAPPVMSYRQPTITVAFDVRDGHCANLRAFLQANGMLEAFEHPTGDSRNLEILPQGRYDELDRSVSGWETNPFGDVHFP